MSLGVVVGGGGAGAAARARVKGRRRAAAREWERGWERVLAVWLFVTFYHLNKYPFITCSRAVFECEVPTRVESYFSSENVDGSQGRHTTRTIPHHTTLYGLTEK